MKIGFSTNHHGPGGARSWIKGFSHYCELKGHELSFGYDDSVDVFCSVANLSTKEHLIGLKNKNIKILQRLGAIYLPYNHPNPLLIQAKNDELKSLIEYADTIVYQSHFCKEQLFRSIYDGHEPDGDIIYNCANHHLFCSEGERLERPTNKKVILAAAYWGTPHTATYSLNILMNTISYFEHRNDIEFWVLGRAFPQHEKIFRKANFNNVTKLDLLNPIEHNLMPTLLRTVDLVLHLKVHEGCSNMVIETLHSGTPIVGIHSGSLPELIGNNSQLASCSECFESFPTIDTKELISKIDLALNNLDRLAINMKKRSENFTPELTYQRYLDKLTELYQST